MKVGLIGLGRMGHAIAQRLLNAGYVVIGFDPIDSASTAFEELGGLAVASIADACAQVDCVWLMVPVAQVDSVLDVASMHIKPGTVVVDGGNSYYIDSMRRAVALAGKNIPFLDCGTSGGLQGATVGFCLMLGGEQASYARVEPIFQAIAAHDGYAHVGPSGTGHYVKMIHNGIEYGLLQAYAEGFQLIKEGSFKDAHLNVEEIARIWNVSAVIRSWILQLTHEIFMHEQEIESVSGEVEQTGMGEWTVQEAQKNNIPVPVIKEAVAVRDWSCKTGGNYGTKIVALLRNKFGGHAVKKIKN